MLSHVPPRAVTCPNCVLLSPSRTVTYPLKERLLRVTTSATGWLGWLKGRGAQNHRKTIASNVNWSKWVVSFTLVTHLRHYYSPCKFFDADASRLVQRSILLDEDYYIFWFLFLINTRVIFWIPYNPYFAWREIEKEADDIGVKKLAWCLYMSSFSEKSDPNKSQNKISNIETKNRLIQYFVTTDKFLVCKSTIFCVNASKCYPLAFSGFKTRLGHKKKRKCVCDLGFASPVFSRLFLHLFFT